MVAIGQESREGAPDAIGCLLLGVKAIFIIHPMFRQKSLLTKQPIGRRLFSVLGACLLITCGLPLVAATSDQERGLFYYVVDRSGSITAYGLTEPISRAITDHASQLPEETEVRLVFFDRGASEPQRWAPMTDEAKEDFSNYFKKSFVPDGPTRLYDTVGEVMEEIRSSTEDYTFVTVLIFSDGENNWSRQYRSWLDLEPVYDGLVSRHEQSFIYWITLEFDPAESPPSWVIHEPQPPGTTDIPVPEPPPVAEFTAHPRQLKVGETIQFEYSARGGRVTEYLWDFGDGNTSYERDPAHEYQQDGEYTVTLVTVGPGGEAREIKEGFVQVAPDIQLTANFRVSSDRIRTGETVTFQDLSEGNPKSWEWRLNDEVFSTDETPSLTMEEAGEIPITLTVRRGNETETATHTITVLPPPPVAEFVIRPEEADYGETVYLSPEKTEVGWNHRWVIDGEITLEGESVDWVSDRHGLLHVVHSVEGPGGFARHSDRLFVHPPIEVLPDTSFAVKPRVFTTGDVVTFQAKETDDSRRHEWLVEGERVGEGPEIEWESRLSGHLVITHRVFVEDTDAVFEESDEILGREPDLVIVRFTASANTGTYPLTVRFSDESEGEGVEYRWDFGDGNYSTARNPTHTYEEAGDFSVVLSVTNREGKVTSNIDPVLLSVVPPMPLWQKAVIGVAIVAFVWVTIIVPLILRPMLAPQKGPRLVGMKTYPLHISGRKSWKRFLWPKRSLTIGSAVDSDIRLPTAGGTRGDLALIERVPAAPSYSIRPLAGNEIFKIEKQTSLTNPDTEEKSKVCRGRVLKDGDTYEIAGERLVWCQPKKRIAKSALNKHRGVAAGRRTTVSHRRKQALAK